MPTTSMVMLFSRHIATALCLIAFGYGAWADEQTSKKDLPASIYLTFGGPDKIAFYDDQASVPEGLVSIHMVLVKPGLAYSEDEIELRTKDAYYISERQITNLQYACLIPGVYYADRATVYERYFKAMVDSWERAYGDRYQSFADQHEPYLLQENAPAILLDPYDAIEAANLLSVRLKKMVTVSSTAQWYRYMSSFGVSHESVNAKKFDAWDLHEKHKIDFDSTFEAIFRRLNEIYAGYDVKGEAPPDQVGVAYSIVWPTDTERIFLREAFPNVEGRASRVVQPHSYFVRGGSLLSFRNATPKHSFSFGSMIARQSQRNLLQGFYLTITAEDYLSNR